MVYSVEPKKCEKGSARHDAPALPIRVPGPKDPQLPSDLIDSHPQLGDPAGNRRRRVGGLVGNPAEFVVAGVEQLLQLADALAFLGALVLKLVDFLFLRGELSFRQGELLAKGLDALVHRGQSAGLPGEAAVGLV
ncbi:hypothetical protein PG988_004442 [Apiospora saccharicola]